MWTPVKLSNMLFLLFLGILVTFSSKVRSDHYLIASLLDQCDSLETPCVTLSSFAANTSNYLQLNTKLVLLPGNHSLYSKLTIKHIHQLELHSSTSHANIVCINQTGRFEFTNISRILISDIKFLGCRGNRVESVTDFTLNNTVFDGQPEDYCFGRAHNSIKPKYIAGALRVTQATASIINCSFYRNYVISNGGAIKGDISSNNTISIANSTFYCNTAWKFGGAIFVESRFSNGARSGVLSIIASNFSYNEARGGGAIVAYDMNVSINESSFMNNQANSGGGGALLSDISGVTTISGTFFNSNSATSGCGGAARMFRIIVSIFNSTFSKNSIDGHGGALCLQESTNNLENCNFNFNEAGTFGGAVYARNSHYTYLVRCSFDTNILRKTMGGGRAMRVYRENLCITNSSFIDRGYLPYNRELYNHTSNCQESNAGYRVSGVGLIMTSSTVLFNSTKFMGSCQSVYAYKCNINFTGINSFMEINNEQSKAPSALYVIQSTVSIDGKCALKFMDNVARSGGAIHASESRLDINGMLEVDNNTALDNGGGIYLFRSDFNCRMGSTINITSNWAKNNGGGIHAISSTIQVTYIRDHISRRSSLYFGRNTAAINGGGVYLKANSKLIVLKEGSTNDEHTHNSSIFFRDNNAAECGGAIFVADKTIGATCEGSFGSLYSDATECFIQVLTVVLMEGISKNYLVGVEFESNTASSGDVLFGGLLDRCTISPIAEVNKVYEYSSGFTYILNITNIIAHDVLKSQNRSIRSKPVQICFCVDTYPNCGYQPSPIKVTHGTEFNISLVAVDQVNHTVENVTIFSSMESSKNWLSKGQIVQNTSDSCTNLTFSILSSGNISVPHNDTLHLYPDGPCKSADRSKRKAEIHLLPCSCTVGFEMSSDRDKCNCECDSRLKDYTTDCNITKGVLVREKNFWISATNNSIVSFCDSSTRYLGYLNCPFDYCVSGNSRKEVNLSRSDGADAQCANNRVGLLCSQCKPGYSLSVGSSGCIHCSKTWVARMLGIVLAFLIAGIVLVMLLLVLNLTVAVGTINGLIFYANVVGSTSKPLTFALPRVVVAWFNLEPGFDGCFINGLDAYWKIWLKVAFPTYIFVLVVFVVVLSRFSPKFSQIIGKRNPVATLNTLILLSYSKLLHLVITIFLFITMDCPGGSSKTVKVWAVDATIEYLSPKHFVLFVVAILILFSGTVYTFLLFSWQWLLLYQDKWLFRWVRNQKLCQFLEPYHAPYTFKHRYWTGLLLLARVVLFTLLATNTSQDPYVSLVAISIAVSSLILIKGVFIRVYKNRLPSILETLCFLSIVFLCIANYYTIHKGYATLQIYVAYASGSIITFLYLFIISYHMYTEIILKTKVWRIFEKCIIKPKTVIQSVATIHCAMASVEPSSYTTTVVEAPQDESRSNRASNAEEINLREPLLESAGGTTSL